MKKHPRFTVGYSITGLILAGFLAAPGCSRSDAGTTEKVAEQQTEKADATNEPTLLQRVLKPKTIDVPIPGGTSIVVRLIDGVSSQSSSIGDRVDGVIANDVVIDGTVAIPAGSSVSGSVTAANALRKIGGRASLALSLTRLTLENGNEYPIQTAFSRIGRSETAKDTATIVGGAIAGAIIGHQIDNDKEGRAIGGIVGAGAGTVIAAKTKGETIELPAGTKLQLTLQDPVNVTVKVDR